MNLLLSCCIYSPWAEVIRNLSSSGFHTKYAVVWNDDIDSYKENFGSEIIFQSVEDAWKGRGFPCIPEDILDEHELKELSWYESNALVMMNRLDPLQEKFCTSHRQMFFRYLVSRWLSVLKHFEIGAVVSPSIPHRVFDYALYVACKLVRVEFIAFQMTPFGSNSLLTNSIDSISPPIIEHNEPDYIGLSPIIKEKLEKLMGDYSSAVPKYMKNHELNNRNFFQPIKRKLKSLIRNAKARKFHKFKRPNSYWVVKDKLPYEADISWIEYGFQTIKNRAFVGALKKRHSKIDFIKHEDIEAPFLLVALHYQPEETTSPTGGSYVDQIHLIKLVEKVAPSNFLILVKEHKSQFYADQESYCGRDKYYYDRISSLSHRVRFVSPEADPFTLIDRAFATITVSGTIGWESAVRGTPAICFGRAWYEGMPNVYKVKTKIELERVLCSIASRKINAEEMKESIFNYHVSLSKRLIQAIHYKSFEKNNDVSLEDSSVNISQAIVDFLRR